MDPLSIPDLVDNKRVTGVTLRDVIIRILEQSSNPSLFVATAYFNLEALNSLSTVLDKVSELRLLIGKEQDQAFVLTERLQRELEDKATRGDLSILPELQKWRDFLRQDKVHIRYYTGGFLHGKAYLISGVPVAGYIGIVGSSNFTGAGLETNLELNAVLKQTTAVEELLRWFENLWAESEDYKETLLDMLDNFTHTYTPYEIYIKILYEAFKDRLQADLSEQEEKPSPIALADFQHDGYFAAKEILEHYGGVILADSVGLGKTYLALRLLDDYAYQMRETALVICPAALRDTLWKPLLEMHAIPHHIESMERISQSDFNIEEFSEYKIIVVDESHNFRNPNANRWRNLFRLLTEGDQTKKVIFLTATPINNTIFDLYHQLRLIARDEIDFFADAGIPNLLGYFRRAEENKDALYEVLEAIAVRRSRPFIRKNYPNAQIDGQVLRFPKRELHTVRYKLERSYGKALYAKVAEAIENLILAPYQVDTFRKEVKYIRQLSLFDMFPSMVKVKGRELPLIKRLIQQGWSKEEAQDFVMAIGRQTALAHIMRVLYLKRLESSVEALRISLRRQLDFQRAFLKAMERGKLLDSKSYRKWLQMESADDQAEGEPNLEAILDMLPSLNPDDYDLERLQKAVEMDIGTLSELLHELDKLSPQYDDKLQALKHLLAERLRDKKVIVFSYFKDTARYIYRQLMQDEEFLMQLGHRRISIVDSGVTTEERKDRIARFAPRANRAQNILNTDRELMILISTDVLSEGQNLQDADTLVNYDLHWNPIRMVQRIGRIDRIGSPHDEVHVYNFYPEDTLEDLLRLMQRLYEKLDAINRAVGLDASVLGETPNPMDFNTLRRIGEEDKKVIDELESESELTVGEFLQQDLWDYLKSVGEERLKRIPLGVGTAKNGKGRRGVFMAFRHLKTGKHYWVLEECDENFNPLRIVGNRLDAIRAVRAQPDEPVLQVPQNFNVDKHYERILRYLINRLNQIAHRLPKMPVPQNQVINWLQAMPPSAIRNELLSYFRHPLTGAALRELRVLWQKERRGTPEKVMKALKEFTKVYPQLAIEKPQPAEVSAEDFECIAWIVLT